MAEPIELASNDLADAYYLEDVSAVVTTRKSPKASVGETPHKIEYVIGKVAPWYDFNNTFPQDVIADVRKTTQLSSGLLWKANALVSGGLVYGIKTIDDKTGEEKFVPKRDQKIEDWNRRTNINRYVREAALEFYTFWNVFTRMRTSNERKIEVIECMNTCDVRLGFQNDQGKIDIAYVNANYDKIFINAIPENKYTLTYPVIDPYFDAVAQFQKDNKMREFIYPVHGPDYDYTYYAKAPWNSFRESEWIKVVQAIPGFKANLLKNQMTIKYHFVLSDLFWKWKYPDYDSFNKDQKDAAKKETLKELNDHMKGISKAGMSLISIAQTDPVTKKNYPGLEIIAIDDKIKDGIYIEDSQEGGSHAYAALGIDGTLVSTMPGKGLPSSGSDKRVAYNIYITNAKSEADLILESPMFAYEANGFTEPYKKEGEFCLWFRNYWITTLDKGKETQQQTS